MRLIFLLPIFFFAFLFLPIKLYKLYNDTCINKDFLSWDGDLRAIKTIELINHLRNFDLVSYIISILDAPTWPTFRNFIESIFLFSTNSISIESIPIFTMITGILVLVLIAYVCLKLETSFITKFLILLSSYFSIYISKEFLIYSFSAMLEIQGAFFFLLSIYFLHQFYSEEYKSVPNLKWKLFLSVFLLFQTKYPYGYLFVFSLLIFHLIHYFSDTLFFALRYLIYLFYSPKKNYRLFGLSILFLAMLFLPSSFLKGKVSTYLKYFIFILLILDFTIYLIRQKAELINLKYDRILILFQFIILPILFFVAIHPDRFGSSSGTIAHVQSEGNLVGVEVTKDLAYYSLFVNSLMDATHIIYLILLISAIFLGYKNYKNKKEIHFSYLGSFLILLSIFILTFLTGNHQSRHIYHFIPAVFLVGLFSFDMIRIEKLKLFFLLLLSIFFGFKIYDFYKISSPNLCFSGKENYIYELPRKVYDLVKEKNLLEDGSIILNAINPIHLNKADTELVLEKLAFEKKIKIDFDTKRLRYYQDKKHKKILFIWDSCDGFHNGTLGNYFNYLSNHFQIEKSYSSSLHSEIIVLKEGIGKIELVKDPNSELIRMNLDPHRCLQIHTYKMNHD